MPLFSRFPTFLHRSKRGSRGERKRKEDQACHSMDNGHQDVEMTEETNERINLDENSAPPKAEGEDAMEIAVPPQNTPMRIPLNQTFPAPFAPNNQQVPLPQLDIPADQQQQPPVRKLDIDYKSSYQTEPIPDPDDPYRPEGTLMLDITHFSDFCRGPPEQQQRLSKSVYVRGIPWKILAIPRSQRSTKALGFFLQCNGDSDGVAWSCIAHATLKVLSKRQGVDDHSRRISHTFYPKENDWGYSQFLTCDVLANPEHGYIEDDTISLVVQVAADAPHGVQWDSKKHTGYIGLKNQGATCYMNSILQTLFFTNSLRRAVYLMPTSEDDADNSVALAMQRVFYDLQHSDKPVGTKKLTKSFGWDSLDSFLQHDVQELCRVLLDNLETKMKATQVQDTIPSLFKGKMKSYIRCTDVDFESSHAEVFYDVQLNVRPKDQSRMEGGRSFTVLDSFRDYVEPERMDGENKYDAGAYGLQPALKGVRFLSFPPILHLQLMRFQFDPTLETNVKVNDRFEFADILDLNEFVEDAGEEDHTYVLHAVLVHSGDFHGGHYVVFINTAPNSAESRWCKFDDDVVSRSTFRDAVAANFGGDDPDVLGRIFTNAYMLVYVRKSMINDVLCEVIESDIPAHLRERFEKEKEDEMNKKKEKMEAHLFMDVYFLTDSFLATHHGFDLFDCRALIDDPSLHEKVEKAMTVQAFYEFVSSKIIYNPDVPEEHELSSNEFRIWQFVDNAMRDECTHTMSLHRQRASSLLSLNPETANKRLDESLDTEKVILYIEMPIKQADGSVRLSDYNDKADMLMFLKYFNHKKKEMVYCGHIMLHFRQNLESAVPECVERAKLPPATKLRFYEEVAPDRIRHIESLSMPLCSEYMLCEVNDGGILIFERIDETTMNDNAKTFLENKYSTIEVEVMQNDDTSQFPCAIIDMERPFLGQVNLTWNALRLSQYVGENVGWDPLRILVWRVSPYAEKPTQLVVESQLKMIRVRELLSLIGDHVHDPRKQKRYRIYYNKLPIPVAEMDKRRQMRITLMDDKFNVTEATVFPERNGTVQSILDEARRIFKFAQGGSGVLRLVYVGMASHSRRVFQIFNNDDTVTSIYQKMLSPAIYTVRVEEIPQDQVAIGPHDFLLPVAHYDKNPQDRMFGVPFYIKVTDGELLSAVRSRIREKLEVPEKEFEKWKFALLQSSRVQKYVDMETDERVRLSDLAVAASPASHIYLGIDHFNRSRGSRSTHAEKAIVIHN